MLDRNGTYRVVRSTGHKSIIPEIIGVGKVRQRYPIFPVHEEGSGIWKEMDALKQILFNSKAYKKIFEGYDMLMNTTCRC